MKWKMKFMFETTNHIYIYIHIHPLVISHNYGKSPFVMGKFTKKYWIVIPLHIYIDILVGGFNPSEQY